MWRGGKVDQLGEGHSRQKELQFKGTEMRKRKCSTYRPWGIIWVWLKQSVHGEDGRKWILEKLADMRSCGCFSFMIFIF